MCWLLEGAKFLSDGLRVLPWPDVYFQWRHSPAISTLRRRQLRPHVNAFDKVTFPNWSEASHRSRDRFRACTQRAQSRGARSSLRHLAKRCFKIFQAV